MCVCIYIYIHIYIYVCVCVCVEMYAWIYIFIYMYVCMYVCMYVYTYTYIYVHISRFFPQQDVKAPNVEVRLVRRSCCVWDLISPKFSACGFRSHGFCTCSVVNLGTSLKLPRNPDPYLLCLHFRVEPLTLEVCIRQGEPGPAAVVGEAPSTDGQSPGVVHCYRSRGICIKS